MNLNAFQRGVRNIKIIIQLATGLNGEKRISHDTIRTTLRRLSTFICLSFELLSFISELWSLSFFDSESWWSQFHSSSCLLQQENEATKRNTFLNTTQTIQPSQFTSNSLSIEKGVGNKLEKASKQEIRKKHCNRQNTSFSIVMFVSEVEWSLPLCFQVRMPKECSHRYLKNKEPNIIILFMNEEIILVNSQKQTVFVETEGKEYEPEGWGWALFAKSNWTTSLWELMTAAWRGVCLELNLSRELLFLLLFFSVKTNNTRICF